MAPHRHFEDFSWKKEVKLQASTFENASALSFLNAKKAFLRDPIMPQKGNKFF